MTEATDNSKMVRFVRQNLAGWGNVPREPCRGDRPRSLGGSFSTIIDTLWPRGGFLPGAIISAALRLMPIASALVRMLASVAGDRQRPSNYLYGTPRRRRPMMCLIRAMPQTITKRMKL